MRLETLDFRPHIMFSPDRGGNEGGGEVPTLEGVVEKYWSRFEKLECCGDLFLERPGGAGGIKLVVPKEDAWQGEEDAWQANEAGLWFKVKGGLWLIPWGQILGQVKRVTDEEGDEEREVKRRSWDEVEKRVARLEELAREMSLPNKTLQNKPPKGSFYPEGTVLQLSGWLTGSQVLEYGELYWLVLRGFKSGGSSMEEIRSRGCLLIVGFKNNKRGRRKRR